MWYEVYIISKHFEPKSGLFDIVIIIAVDDFQHNQHPCLEWLLDRLPSLQSDYNVAVPKIIGIHPKAEV
jgi:hypothetical protein